MNALDSKRFSGVVRLLNAFHYKSHYCLVLELLNSTLQKYKDEKKMTMKDIRWITFQLLSTVSFLHSNEFIHADLKPENILLGSGTFITDHCLMIIYTYNLFSRGFPFVTK